MCRNCLRETRPDRARVCLDNGSYMMNFLGCSNCQALQPLSVAQHNREENDDTVPTEDENPHAPALQGDYEEIITYQHTCSSCSHVVADHYYSFLVTNSAESAGTRVQEFLMDCVLCGRGADSSYVINDVGKCSSEIPQPDRRPVENLSVNFFPRGPGSLEGALRFRAPGKPSFDILDELLPWVQNLCFKGVELLTTGSSLTVNYFSRSGRFVVTPDGENVEISDSFHHQPPARYAMAEFLREVLASGDRFILSAEESANLNYVKQFQAPAHEALREWTRKNNSGNNRTLGINNINIPTQNNSETTTAEEEAEWDD